MKIYSFLVGAALAMGSLCASADDTSVATVPDGMMSFSIKHGETNYISLPLTKVSTYTGSVSSATTSSITVDDTPAPFTFNMATPNAPYFVKFLSGNEAGRVMLITANTTGTATLDTTDHVSGEAVALTTTGFDVQAGDMFEIFPGDTIASVFGDNSSDNQVILTGAAKVATADVITLYTASNVASVAYYFNTTLGFWVKNGSKINANNAIIYPYSAFTIVRRAAYSDTAVVVSGRVTQVAAETKVVGRGSVYTSSHFATDVKLSQLQFGSTWTQGSTVRTADNLSVWNATLGRFDIFYQLPDSTWRKYPDANTDQSNFTIAAGSVTAIAKKAVVRGASTFLQTSLPYTLQ